MNVGDRPIGGVDHSQGRGVGLDEEQRGVRIVSSVANSLSAAAAIKAETSMTFSILWAISASRSTAAST